MKSNSYYFRPALCWLSFALFTLLVRCVDVRPIGPEGSAVGLAALNGLVRDAVGFHRLWYDMTDWLGLAALGVAAGFALLGLCQLIARRSLLRVDANILVLGGVYLVAIAAYLLFEVCIINYRPVLMQGQLEASYPSSHTMLVVCILGTALPRFRRYLPGMAHAAASGLGWAVMTVTVAGRLISGVHWFTDILGGLLLALALVQSDRALCRALKD